jgi:hypothetical protein
MIAGILFGFLPLAIWLYLLLFTTASGGCCASARKPVGEPATWPPVVAVVPAQWADVIAQYHQPVGSGLSRTVPWCWWMINPRMARVR